MYIGKVTLREIRGATVPLVFDPAKAAAGADATTAGWKVIAGGNGRGKTTLLQGIAACLAGPSGTAWLLPPDEIERWIRVGAEGGSAAVEIERVPADDGADRRDETRRPTKLQVNWRRQGGAQQIDPPGNRSFVSSQFWDASSSGKPDGWIFLGYGARRAIQRSSNDALRLLRGPPRTAGITTLFRDDAALERGLEWLDGLALSEARGNQKNRQLLNGLLRFLGDGLIRPGEASTFVVEERGLELVTDIQTPTYILGDGFRVLIWLVLDILYHIERFKPGRLLEEIDRWPGEGSVQVQMSGTVVIDEPELHLHPRLQQHIGFWLKAHFPKIQFIVTTHSTLVCQAADRGGLFSMPRPFQIEQLDDLTWKKVTMGTVNDAITTRLFGLETPWAPDGAKKRKELSDIEARMQLGEMTSEIIDERQRLIEALEDPIDLQIRAALDQRPSEGQR